MLPRLQQELQDKELDPRLSGEQGLQMYSNSVPKMEEVLPPVNSDQSLLDGSSESVKDAQRMMLLNNPIPNPTESSVPTIDSVPQSVQDSQRMIDINADNAFIPKIPSLNKAVNNEDVYITEMEDSTDRISEEISNLRLQMSVMESGSPMRAILQTRVDQKLGELAAMGSQINPNALPVPKQTGVDTGLISAKVNLEKSRRIEKSRNRTTNG